MSRKIAALSLFALLAAGAPAHAGGDFGYGGGYGGPQGAYWQRSGEDPWYGVYIGGFGGGAWGSSEGGRPTLNNTQYPVTTDFDADGGLGGGTLGAQLQWGWFVFGVEADLGFGSVEGSGASVVPDPRGVAGSSVSYGVSTELQDLGTVRLRAGYAFDRVMLFATGGFAFGNVDAEALATYSVGPESGRFHDEQLLSGFSVGGGGEFLLTPHISLKAEYMFVDLSGENFRGRDPLTGDTLFSDVDFRTHMIRGGVNYKF